MTIAIAPARTHTSRDDGPMSRAPIAVATYTSAPMIEPTTRLVTSKVFSLADAPVPLPSPRGRIARQSLEV